MKKTFLALILTIFLSFIWGIASWFTGKSIENHFSQYLENVNTQLNRLFPDEKIHLGYQHYRRGIFRSHVQLMLEAKGKTAFFSGKNIFLNETIDHGPFPLSQIKMFSFFPAMASIHTELEKTDTVAKLFEIAQNHSIFQADTKISYRGANQTRIHLNPVNYRDSENQERYSWNEGVINIYYHSRNKSLDIKSHINNVIIETAAEGKPVIFTLDALNLNSSKTPSFTGIPISNHILEIKKLGASVNEKNTLMLENLTGKTIFSVEGETGSLDMNYQLHNVKLENLNLGSGNLAMTISKLNVLTLKNLIDDYKAQWENVLNTSVDTMNHDEYQKKAREFFIKHIPELLKSSPEIKIRPLSWENQGGKSFFSLDVVFQDPSIHTDPHQHSIIPIKTLESQLTLNKTMLTEIVKHIAMINGEEESLAGQYAMLKVKSIATLAAISGLVTQKDDVIQVQLKYSNDILVINGRKISLEQLLSGYIPPSVFTSERIEEEE